MPRRKKKEYKPLPEQPCKNCERMIPVPMDFCSSRCFEDYYEKHPKEKEQRDKETLEWFKKQFGKENVSR